MYSDCYLPIPNQGLEFEADLQSLEGFPCHHSSAIGNRSRTTEEKVGGARLDRNGARMSGVELRSFRWYSKMVRAWTRYSDRMRESPYHEFNLKNRRTLYRLRGIHRPCVCTRPLAGLSLRPAYSRSGRPRNLRS